MHIDANKTLAAFTGTQSKKLHHNIMILDVMANNLPNWVEMDIMNHTIGWLHCHKDHLKS